MNFDPDAGGARGTERSINLLLAEECASISRRCRETPIPTNLFSNKAWKLSASGGFGADLLSVAADVARAKFDMQARKVEYKHFTFYCLPCSASTTNWNARPLSTKCLPTSASTRNSSASSFAGLRRMKAQSRAPRSHRRFRRTSVSC